MAFSVVVLVVEIAVLFASCSRDSLIESDKTVASRNDRQSNKFMSIRSKRTVDAPRRTRVCEEQRGKYCGPAARQFLCLIRSLSTALFVNVTNDHEPRGTRQQC